MKYFKLMQSGIDVSPLYNEILENDDMWHIPTKAAKREETVPVQQETNSIFIRAPIRHGAIALDNNQESDWTSESDSFPLANAFMKNFAEHTGGSLSRALIVRVKPKGRVYRHVESGSYYFIRNRYHLILKSTMGSILYAGDEKVTMQEGEVWWFNNKQQHQAENPSDDWRIHYIFDVLPKKYEKLAQNPIPLENLPTWFVNAPRT